MKISTRGQYGVRFLMDLMAYGQEGNVTLAQVAKRQSISEKYLWQVVNPLKKEGLIRSVSGPGGGYTLARTPESITLRDILEVLEGDCSLVTLAQETFSAPLPGNARAAQEIWRELDKKLAQVLSSITLRDVDNKQQAVAQSTPSSYAI